MLENAGAVVVQPRERDTQKVEDVVDDTHSYSQLSVWVKGEGTGWGEDEDGMLLEGENPFDKGSYMVAPVSNKEIAELRYTPKALPAGEYAVYISYKSLPNSTTAAKIYTRS